MRELTVSGNFGASMPVVGPVQGFANVQSNFGKKLFADAVFQNAAMKADLAGRAIQSKSAASALKRNLAAQVEAQATGSPSRGDALRMAGTSLMNLFGGSSSSGGFASVDPLAMLDQFRARRDVQRQRLGRDTAATSRSVEDAIRLLS